MSKQRPVNLDLTKFHFPPMAILSICHRISGVLLFLLLPIAIWLLHNSLISSAGFDATVEWVNHPLMKLLICLMLCATLFHLVAGIRHLLMDIGLGESVAAGRASAYAVFGVAIVLFILVGVWVW